MAKGSKAKRGKKGPGFSVERRAAKLEKALAAGLRREAKAASRLEAVQLEVAVLRSALSEVLGSPVRAAAAAGDRVAQVVPAPRPATRVRAPKRAAAPPTPSAPKAASGASAPKAASGASAPKAAAPARARRGAAAPRSSPAPVPQTPTGTASSRSRRAPRAKPADDSDR
jgi:hypothetical protein